MQKGVDVILLLFSVVTQTSFDSVQTRWVPLIQKNSPLAKVILIGTKIDLMSNEAYGAILKEKGISVVTKECGDLVAKKIGGECYMEVSSLSQHGITPIFKRAGEIYVQTLRNTRKQRKKHCTVI